MKKYHNCLVCNKQINKLDDLPKDQEWEGVWQDGIVQKIDAGYGSCLDGDMFCLAICDDCVIEKYKEGKIKHVGNYMFHGLGREFVMPEKYK